MQLVLDKTSKGIRNVRLDNLKDLRAQGLIKKYVEHFFVVQN